MSSIKYIPHIDSLRGLAVLLVLSFHFNISFLSGGFIGVDMFFVISGFLISSIIQNKISKGSFSYKDFYLRRIKRLLPAGYTTIIVTCIFSLYIFPINLFEKVVKTGLPSMLSFSNIHFFKESGYFDITGELKPLLHTWSLSVEEQFYLIWPVLVVIYLKIKNRVLKNILLGILFISSLISSEYFLSIDESASFYLTPFRGFEFMIGAIGVNIHLERFNKTIKEMLTLFSLIGIISISTLYNQSTKFPGINAIFPCLFTIILIISTQKNSFIGSIYNNAFFRYLGKISYSLYLVHWPILVFYKYKITQKFNIFDLAILYAASFLLAIGLYYIIENKFRHSKNTKYHVPALLTSILLFVGLNVYTNNSNLELLKNKDYPEYSSKEIRFESRNRERHIQEAQNLTIDTIPGKRVLIIGDSHAPDALNFLKIAYPNYKYNIITNGGCPPLTKEDFFEIQPGDAKMQNNCLDCIESLYYKDICKNYDYVVISTFIVGKYKPQHILNFINKMKLTTSAQFIVFGNFIQFTRPLPDILANGGINYQKDIQDFALHEETLKENAKNNYKFYSKTDLLCSSQNPKNCTFIIDNKKLLTYDSNHLSYYACEIIAQNIKLKKLEILK